MLYCLESAVVSGQGRIYMLSKIAICPTVRASRPVASRMGSIALTQRMHAAARSALRLDQFASMEVRRPPLWRLQKPAAA